MINDETLSCVPCYVEGCVKRKEFNFCIVCFANPEVENMDVVVTDNFQLAIVKYFSEFPEDYKIPKDFYIQVISTRSFLEVLEVFRNEKSL